MSDNESERVHDELRFSRNRRRAFKGQLTNVSNQVRNPDTTFNALGLELILKRLQTIYRNFDDVQSKIEAIDPTEADKPDRSEFEELYGQLEMLVSQQLAQSQQNESQTSSSHPATMGPRNATAGTSMSVQSPTTQGAAAMTSTGTTAFTPNDETQFDDAFSSTHHFDGDETSRHVTASATHATTHQTRTTSMTMVTPTLTTIAPTRTAPGVSTQAAWTAPGVSIQAAWTAPGVPTQASWTAPGVPTQASWTAPGVPTQATWTAPGVPTQATWTAPGVPTQAAWTAPGVSTQSTWCHSNNGTTNGPVYATTAAGNLAPQPPIIIQMPSQPQMSLSELGMRKFDGEDESWIRFRDVYQGMVHNTNMPDLRKFLALEACLIDGKAYRHIQGIPISAENYMAAWTRVCSYYENRDRILRSHIRQIYDIPKVQEGSATSLQQFRTTFDKHYFGLISLGQDVSTWDIFLVHHLARKLDAQTRQRYEAEAALRQIDLGGFLNIVQQQIQVSEAMQNYKNLQSSKQKPSGTRSYVTTESDKACPFCYESHSPFKCSTFKAYTIEGRIQEAKKHKLCLNCLSPGHFLKDCTSGTCRKCKKKHHTLLCSTVDNQSDTSGGGSQKQTSTTSTAQSSSKGSSQTCNMAAEENEDEEEPILSCSSVERSITRKSQILLATAVLYIRDADGNRHICRALIDSGSMRHLISENLVQKLRLRRQSSITPIAMLNGTKSKSNYKVNALIESRSTSFSARMNFIVMPKVTGDLPLTKLPFDSTRIPKGVQLADPFFFRPEKVDIILGAEHYHQLVSGKKRHILPELPPFIETVFGYALMGEVKLGNDTENETTVFMCHDDDLLEQVHQFWRQEEIVKPNNWSIEEKAAEEHYKANVKRDERGRYSVALPTKDTLTKLGVSADKALRQLYWMEKRLQGNSERREEYNQFMREYLEMGHMEPVEIGQDPSKNPSMVTYTIPHHFIIKETSTTTRLRVVFNASFPTSTGLSLNETLMVGPTIQADLFTALNRFRSRPIGMTSDIAKMYRQVGIHENQRDLQRIWWRESQNDPVRCFRLTTVTYGTASAPFLATRTLTQLAEDEQAAFPKAAELLKNGFYVDDLTASFETSAEASEMKEQLNLLVKRGGMELRKWHSNQRHLSDDPNIDQLFILGLVWNLNSDTLQLPPIELLGQKVITRRTILSNIAKMSYDPLGFFAPTIVCAKLIMQKIFCDQTRGWDDPVSEEMEAEWTQLIAQLPKMASITIPRCIKAAGDICSIEIHAFGDASQYAFGSCVYLKVSFNSGEVSVKLMAAKSRVAPRERPTIPRLELNAAVLTAELATKIISGLTLTVSKVSLYSDSTITLARINSAPADYKVYVANRVVQIQELFPPTVWHFVSTHDNPADIVSRGMLPHDLKDSKLWWNGPAFLHERSNRTVKIEAFPFSNFDDERRVPEIVANMAIPKEKFEIFDRYSSFNRLVRIFAWMRRFITNVDKKSSFAHTKEPELTGREIHNAILRLVGMVQKEEFSDEIKHLKKGKFVNKDSRLKRLNPLVDKFGLLRVGGRLENSSLPYGQKHPLLLPANHPLTALLVRHEHLKHLHAGQQTLMNIIRQNYWIIHGRNIVKKIVHNCLSCFRARPRGLDQLMGQLPATRVEVAPPFTHTGVDYAGYFEIKLPIRSRANTRVKVYIALFICLVTKAIHLEVVTGLTTEAFIAAFRRFVARRGQPQTMKSDNGTTFIGARTQLTELQRLLDSQDHQKKVIRACTPTIVEWRTIPARSPHFGGIWESNVKNTKTLLKRTFGDTVFTLEEFQTAITQIEAIVNSRPISPMTDDPSDPTALTPGHFLVGRALTAVPDPDLSSEKINRLSQWQLIQRKTQEFWRLWRTSYLNELQQRNKWFQSKENIKVGALVLLRERDSSSLNWPMGRVESVSLGKDGRVRAANIRTATGMFSRAITEICQLPIKDEEEVMKNRRSPGDRTGNE